MAEKEQDHATIRKTALRLLSCRDHGRGELQNKLTMKGYAPAVVEALLDELDQAGWLSEARFIESFIRARLAKGYGPLRIRAELKERGVDDELIADRLDANDEMWLQCLAKAHAKRFGVNRPAAFAERARRIRYFQTRGFTMEQIRKVIERGEVEI